MMPITPLFQDYRLRLLGRLGAVSVRLLIGSLHKRIEVLGADQLSADQPCIVATWHETLLVPLRIFAPQRPYTLISQSDDGERIARIAGALGWRIVRGSSSRGAAMAMRSLLIAARQSDCFQIVITVDGPRGPRRRCKEGVVYLASRLGIPLLPLGVSVGRAWRTRSWDRFVVPKPFSRAALVGRELIHVPTDLSSAQIAEQCRRVDEAMREAEQQAMDLVHASDAIGVAREPCLVVDR